MMSAPASSSSSASAAPAPHGDDAASTAASAAAPAASSPSASAAAPTDEDADEKPAKRVWTASELAARAEAQRIEDAESAKEEAQLREEQKALSKQIVSRRVVFSNLSSSASTHPSDADGCSSSSSLASGESSDYTRHDGRRRTTVMFVEQHCSFAAPVAVAAAEMLHPTLLSAGMAAAAAAGVAPVNPLLERVLEERLRLPSGPLTRRPLDSASTRSVDFLISFDEASRIAADALVAAPASAAAVAAGKLRRIHQEFGALAPGASWGEADALGSKIKEFVSELPELLSMM